MMQYIENIKRGLLRTALVIFVVIPTLVMGVLFIPIALAWQFAMKFAEEIHDYTSDKLN
jgi:hypothetical protein